MLAHRIVHRVADGVRIAGTWRHAFLRNGGTYHLTDLFIYADGLVDCWGLVTLEEFAEQLRHGRVATELPEGAPASAHELATWRFGEPRTWLTPELLLAEIRDTVDRLNRRPDSTGRCLDAVDTYLADRTEENLAAARAAYRLIPESRRHYALGDMDNKDRPLRALLDGPEGPGYAWALEYFAERAAHRAEHAARAPVPPPAVQLHQTSLRALRENPGKAGLRNDYPAPLTVDGTRYASVAVALVALSLEDPGVRARAAAADSPYAARRIAGGAACRPDWTRVRSAVLADLLRAKYAQHPSLARILRATGDATLLHDDIDSDFWGDNGGRGRNQAGRLLELVRAELHLQEPPRDMAPAGADTMGE
ncbi:NADAR family protein [Streptomyces sp. NPDC059853]|uniref:NADAR family protein n=1 Tax=Streptomyces sp. NPDC059853 TaxID=3346973 RepID=UPI00365B3323